MKKRNSVGVRVLLVNSTSWQKKNVSLGLAYLSGACDKAGDSVSIPDLIMREMNDSDVVARTKASPLPLIGKQVKTAT